MRTSGLGPWRALGTMVLLGLGFVLFTGFWATTLRQRPSAWPCKRRPSI